MGDKITSIKGTDLNLRCRDFQFEVGKTYTVSGDIKACERGFHACPIEHHPLSVFEYYPPGQSRFWEVTQGGETSAKDNKLASAEITISVEISIGDLVKRAWDYVWSRAEKCDGDHATGERGAASATGARGAASATGDWGAASATGTQGAASATGARGAASATGERGAASATGARGAASATGDWGAASATGERGAATASGYEGRVMGRDGNALFAVERDNRCNIVSVASGIVGKDGIKAYTWYLCKSGKLVEAQS